MRYSQIPTPANYQGRVPFTVVRVDADPGDNLLGEARGQITIAIRPCVPQPNVLNTEPCIEYAIYLAPNQFSADDAAYVAEFRGSIGHGAAEIARQVLDDHRTRFAR
jgi:hypothetical protein